MIDVGQELISFLKDACRMTGISRSKLYELIAAGEVVTVKVGSMTLVPVAGLKSFFADRVGAGSGALRPSAAMRPNPVLRC